MGEISDRKDRILRRVCGCTVEESDMAGIPPAFNHRTFCAVTMELLLLPWVMFLWVKKKVGV